MTSSIGQGEPLGLDILTQLVDTADFGELYHKTLSLDGIVIPYVEYSFAIKLKVMYIREDDDNGQKKVKNDAFDLVYLTKILVEQGRQVSDEMRFQIRDWLLSYGFC